ncbi:uncharacterized protein BDR25DRAFT_282694 [Lindgomyces ingoldianus]|uniref:Uncharacterized protein n=1 Tax=Lindgomyces ingoldianus TaxID=673940 RepID=A0ACB6R2J6_9PLEO|nr:uncharacterized protein BDR25DRAFT_282694 [Lindgomyces ingoldianus]KAF2473282.1 hypothetical protein BDR25DRAFT_282694 [Lindgomyces ingoldianus]
MSAPTVTKAETSYPIFAATFAHSHPGCLVVAGGGGAGRSGVGNKITAFDVSSRAPNVDSFAEIDLSRDEDSVTCLANLATKDGLILYAGINSSEADRLKGKNEHFRAFEVAFPKNRRTNSASSEKKPQGKVSFLSKTSLFKSLSTVSAKKDGYQRIVRLSPAKRSASGNKRIGAIASSLAGDENEIVVFNATSNLPRDPGDVIHRVALSKGQEANDLDILEPEDGQFKIAYCTDNDVYVQEINYDFGKKKPLGMLHSPEKKYTVPFPDVFEKKGRSKIRCLRWLSPSHLLLLANLPNRTGVELHILRIYGDTMGSITLRKRLSRHVKAAVDMDVACLDPDGAGAYQIVMAVAGIDISISLLTMEYYGTSKNSVSSFHSYATYRDVHPLQMTKLIFSPFFSPWTAPQAPPSKKPGPQYLRLASISLGNTISVESFTLQPVSSKPRSRYLLSSASSRRLYQGAMYFSIAFVIVAIAILVQSLFDPEGTMTKGLVSEDIRRAVGGLKPPGLVMEEAHLARAVSEGMKTPAAQAPQRLRDLLHFHHQENHANTEKKAVVIRHDPNADSSLSTEVHTDTNEAAKKHTEAKKWEELSHAERSRWKEKLIKAGMWAVDEGETVLKGIFFSEAAGIVGAMAQGIING